MNANNLKISIFQKSMVLIIALFFGSLPNTAYCFGTSKQERQTYKENNKAMNKAPVKQGSKWRKFTRLERPGENIEKNGIKKNTWLLSEHKKGRPSLNKYKEDTGIDKSRKGTVRVEGFYKPESYKQADIKGKGTKSYSKQEMPTKNVSPNNIKITSKTRLK